MYAYTFPFFSYIFPPATTDQILSKFIPEPDVRQFLLKNLSRTSSGGFEWKINLEAIDRHIEEIGEGMQFPGTYNKPTLFIKGAKSNYYADGDEELIKSIFIKATFSTLDTGHWGCAIAWPYRRLT